MSIYKDGHLRHVVAEYIQLLDDGHLAQMEMTIDVLSALLQMPRRSGCTADRVG